PGCIELPLAHQHGEWRSLHELEREVEAVLRLARLVDGDHVGVFERRLEPTFTAEPLDELWIRPELGRDHLQRRATAVLDMACGVDDRHPAPAEHPLDAVVTHYGAW